MQRNILTLKEICHGVHRRCTHLCNFILWDVGVVGIHLHAKTNGKLPNSPGYSTKPIKGNGTANQLKAAGSIKIVPSTDQHHAKNEFSHCVCILPRCIHGADILSFTGRQINVVIASTCTDNNL